MTIYASYFLMLCALLAVYVGCALNATASEASKNNDRRFALVCAILGLFFWIAAVAIGHTALKQSEQQTSMEATR